MTVQTTAGPGTEEFRSSKFALSVNGSATYVSAFAGPTLTATTEWAQGDTIETSFVTFGSDEVTTVAITLVSGDPIVSADVYTDGATLAQTIAGGVLSLTVPANRRFRVEVNGDRSESLTVSGNPLTVVPTAITDYTTLAQTITSIVGQVVTVTGSTYAPGARLILKSTTTLPVVTGGAISTYEAVTVVDPVEGGVFNLLDASGQLITFDDIADTSGLSLTPAEWTDTATTLLFPAGFHLLGRLFKLGAGVKVYLSAGAVVDGNWDVRESSGVKFYGPGTAIGRYTTSWAVRALTDFNDKLFYCLFVGLTRGVAEARDNVISECTLADFAFYCTNRAWYRWQNVTIVSPHNFTTDGVKFSRVDIEGEVPLANDCNIFVGDDAVILVPIEGATPSIATSLVCTSANSCFHFGYHPESFWSGTAAVLNCAAVHLGLADSDSYSTGEVIGSDSVFKSLTDGWAEDFAYGISGIVDGLAVLGPLQCRLFIFGNVAYPFEASGKRRLFGQVAGWNVRNVTVEQAPPLPSLIVGKDAANTPNDITFDDLVIGGVAVTPDNYRTFVTVDPLAYDIAWLYTPLVVVDEPAIVVDSRSQIDVMLDSVQEAWATGSDVFSYTVNGQTVTRNTPSQMIDLHRYLLSLKQANAGIRRTRARFS